MKNALTFVSFMLICLGVLSFSVNWDVAATLLLLVGFGLGSYNYYSSPSNSN